MDISAALERLNSQLPLKARQDALPSVLKATHQSVLYSLAERGRPPTMDELEVALGMGKVEAALQRLGADDLIVLDAEGKQLVGAYPVTLEQTPHKISVNGNSIHAMCALDAVSVAPMFDAKVTIDSTCHVSATPITVAMQGREIVDVKPTAEVTVGIRWRMPSAVAAHSMCMEMVFLKDRRTVQAWLNGDTENIALFTLPEAVAFGTAFFRPLLD
ncbi:MAG: alkylmercury lyase family protein [Pseudomonadota bacterium]|nr:MAG: alkylmercury lyase family protein [Pseudomonadota bacterium]